MMPPDLARRVRDAAERASADADRARRSEYEHLTLRRDWLITRLRATIRPATTTRPAVNTIVANKDGHIYATKDLIAAAGSMSHRDIDRWLAVLDERYSYAVVAS